MKLHKVGRLHAFATEHKVGTAVFAVIGLWGAIIVAQLIYPWNNLSLGVTVSGVEIGGKTVEQAEKILNKKYSNTPVQLYFGDSETAYSEPKPSDLGLNIDSGPTVQSVKYEIWQRFIPFSILWAKITNSAAPPSYQYDETVTKEYVKREFGKSCNVEPVNATIENSNGKLKVVSAIDGGKCDFDTVVTQIINLKPTLGSSSVRIGIDPSPAKITDKQAAEYVTKLQDKTATGLTISVGGKSVTVSQQTLFSWLDFESPDSGIVVTVNKAKSKEFFEKQVSPKVEKPSGTSYVTTLDFTVISQQTGPSGATLDDEATRKAIEDWLAGSDEVVTARISVVAPTVIYTRKYSSTDTGLTALMTQFAQSHPGIYGVSLVELDGQKRRAAYNDTKLFRTASTYKLFVAYSTLKRIDSGKWKWSDQVVGGRNLSKCFDDMIVLSDNPCAEALLEKIGFQTITNEIRAIGLTRSSFLNKFIETTAGDLTTFVGALQMKQLPLSDASRNTLLSAMERNVYRQGIPAGAKGSVADKVGFLEDYLNDAAIVYSPTGTYALTIMTKGSSWGNIAELTRQIEALRTK